jgi:hypothetical protein
MAQGLNSTKIPARPSHEAVEDETTADEASKSDRERMDHAAMQSAKRAQNRIHADEDITPGNTQFTK